MRAQFLIALLLLAAAAPLAEAGGRLHKIRDADRDDDAKFDANPNRDAALARAEQHGLFAKWHRNGEHVHGRFVSFHVGGSFGELENFAYRNGSGAQDYRTIFSSIEVDAFTKDTTAPGSGVKVAGSLLRLYGTDGLMRVHNNPLAAVRFLNGEEAARNVVFTLSANATLGPKADEGKSIRINLTNFRFSDHAHIVVSNGTLTPLDAATDRVTVALEKGGSAALVLHPKGFDPVRLHALIHNMAKGRLGAAAGAVVVDGKAVLQSDEVDVELEAGNVTAKRFAFKAKGEGIGGRVVVMNLAKADFPGLRNGSMEVLIGGTKAALVSEASAHTATSGAANVTFTGDGIVLTVYVPHFSTQEVVLQATETTPAGGDDKKTGGGIPGVPVLLLLAAVAVLAAVRRR